MSNKLCRRAIETRIAAWAAARVPALPVAFENVVFAPVQGAPYLRVFLLPSDTDSEDLAGSHRLYHGVYQINIVAPSAAGPGTAEGIEDEIAALFPLNLRMTVPGLTVRVSSPVTASSGVSDATGYIIPVSFQYRADTI